MFTIKSNNKWVGLRLPNKLKIMETIFDHNVTEEEKIQIIGNISKDLYFSFVGADSAIQDIAYLYYIRKDIRNMKKYANKIINIDLRNSFWRTVRHPATGCQTWHTGQFAGWNDKLKKFVKVLFECINA